MNMITIVLSAAKSVGVSGSLLLAICSHESNNFKLNYNSNDKGTPSFGSCQLKAETAKFMGFKGSNKLLMKPTVNAFYAAKYLKYQQENYGNDWVKLTASYNSGTYRESSKILGCPKNLKYVRFVQKKLPPNLQNKLNCGVSGELAGNP